MLKRYKDYRSKQKDKKDANQSRKMLQSRINYATDTAQFYPHKEERYPFYKKAGEANVMLKKDPKIARKMYDELHQQLKFDGWVNRYRNNKDRTFSRKRKSIKKCKSKKRKLSKKRSSKRSTCRN
jgi:hypothetical protein